MGVGLGVTAAAVVVLWLFSATLVKPLRQAAGFADSVAHEKLNSAILGFGPVFCKFTGHRGKVGANDAHPEYVAWLRNLLDGAGIPWQMAELGRVDLGGGGTVAKFLAVYGMAPPKKQSGARRPKKRLASVTVKASPRP